MKNFLRYLKYSYNSFKNRKNKIGARRTFKAFIHGFNVDEYAIYGLDKNNYKDYVPDYIRLKNRFKINGKASIILDNKLIFKSVFKDKIPLAKMCFYKIENHIYDNKNNPINLENFLNQMRDGKYILKPLNLGGGNQVKKIEIMDNKIIIDNKVSNLNEFGILINNMTSFIIEEVIRQAEYSHKIFPNSVNTIRMITIKNSNGEIEAITAVHRFGVKKSAPTDNLSRGGIVCEIDLETGTIKTEVSKVYPFEIKVHPDTNVKIYGTKIPRFNEIKKRIIECHKDFNFFNMIAWDTVVTKNDFVVIEANTSCEFDALQISNGLRKTKLNDFYVCYGVYK